MTIDGRRVFTYNGRKYMVQNLQQADKRNDKEKYYLTVECNGFWKTAYNNIGWDVEHFNTIKDAQRYVRDWDFILDTLY